MDTPAISNDKLARLTNQANIIELLNTDRLGDKVFCDATIKAEENIYSVHTFVLGIVSEYFKILFNTKINEGQTNEALKEGNARQSRPLYTTDMPSERLELVLEFVYCGGVEISNDNVLTLIDVAEYTQIHGLKLACSTFLLGKVKVANCLKLRSYAKRYNLDKVLEKIYETIGYNFADVAKFDDFMQLGEADITEIVQKESVSNQAEAVFTGILAWINHDSIGRNDLFVGLFNQLNLSMISTEFFTKNVITEELVRENATCANSVFVALSQSKPAYQLNVHQHSTADLAHLMIIGLENSSYVKFDAITQKTTPFPSPNRTCSSSAFLLMGSKMFRIGGDDNSCEIFDKDRSPKWSFIYDMPGCGKFAAATAFGGNVYVSGGNIPMSDVYSPKRSFNTQEAVATFLKYDVNNETWSQVASMDTPRSRHAMVVFKDVLYCFGGLQGDDTYDAISCCEKYTNNVWRPIAKMNEGRYGFAVAVLNGFIYAIGGGRATVERYDPKTNQWLRRQAMQCVRTDHAACALNGKIYVAGGDYGNSVEAYDPQRDTWTTCCKTQIGLTKTYMFAV